MNKKIKLTTSLMMILGISSIAMAGSLSPATCSSLLSLTPTYANCSSPNSNCNNCINNAGAIRQCIQNSLASQIPASSSNNNSLSTQIQAVATASQTLGQLDYQCQYLLANGQPQATAPGSGNGGGLGGSLKSLLGLPSQPATNSSTASAPNTAAANQASKLNNLQAASPPAKNSATQKNNKDNSNNSINWF